MKIPVWSALLLASVVTVSAAPANKVNCTEAAASVIRTDPEDCTLVAARESDDCHVCAQQLGGQCNSTQPCADPLVCDEETCKAFPLKYDRPNRQWRKIDGKDEIDLSNCKTEIRLDRWSKPSCSKRKDEDCCTSWRCSPYQGCESDLECKNGKCKCKQPVSSGDGLTSANGCAIHEYNPNDEHDVCVVQNKNWALKRCPPNHYCMGFNRINSVKTYEDGPIGWRFGRCKKIET